MGSWTQINSPMTRWVGQMHVVYNSQVYLMSGWQYAVGYTNNCYRYDPNTKTFTQLANSAIGYDEGFGGIVGSTFYSCRYDQGKMQNYSIPGNSWTTTTMTLNATWGSENAYVSITESNVVLLAGAYVNSGTSTNVAWTWNGSTFTAKANFPANVESAVGSRCTGAPSTTAHVAGGFTWDGVSSKTGRQYHYEYSYAANTWTGKAGLPIAEGSIALSDTSGAIDGMLMAGGRSNVTFGAATTYSAAVYGYRYATNVWTQLGPNIPLGPNAFAGNASVGPNNLAIFGGESDAGEYDYTQIFNPNNPPNAPAINSPPSGTAADASQALTFSWSFSDPDAGDTQSAWALRLTDTGTATNYWFNASNNTLSPTELFNSGAASSTTIPGGVLTNTKTYNWSVATKDAYGAIASPYSAARSLVLSSTPQVTLIAPISGGVVTGLATQRAYWAYSQATNDPQASYQINLMDINSNLVWDSGQVASGATSAVIQGLANAQTYTVYVRAATASGNWSSWASAQFTTSADANLGVAARLTQTIEYVYRQLTTQIGRPAPDVDTDAAVQNSQQPIIRLALGTTNMTPNGSESGGVVPGEIVGGSLTSAVAGAISHTTGTNSFTLQQNWTADTAYTVYLVGVLNNMTYPMALGQPRFVAGAANQRRLAFLFRLPNPINVQAGDSFETDVTVTF